VAISGLLYFASRSVLGLFLHDPAVTAQGTPLFRIAMAGQAA
jgi:hypothetical protein